jgi:hypothetical protein
MAGSSHVLLELFLDEPDEDSKISRVSFAVIEGSADSGKSISDRELQPILHAGLMQYEKGREASGVTLHEITDHRSCRMYKKYSSCLNARCTNT